MPDAVAFASLTIESFRGFKNRYTFDLDASVVLLSGPNGTGKTSFFDAFQWLILGDIGRLREARNRPNEEYVVNQYRRGESAVVEAVLRAPGTSITVRRSGRSAGREGSLLEWIEGERTLRGVEAEERLAAHLLGDYRSTLSQQFLSSGMLQQDAIRSVLETKPADRYGLLRQMLGLNAIEEFEDATTRHSAVQASAQKVAQQSMERLSAELQEALDRLETLERRVMSSVQADEALNAVRSAIERAGLRPTEPLSVQSVAAISATAAALATEIRRMVSEQNGIARQLEQGAPSNDSAPVDQIRTEWDAAVREHEELTRSAGAIQVALSEAEAESNAVERLVASALPLLTDECPVCGQSIAPDAVRERLLSVASDAARMEALRQDFDDLQRSLVDAARRRDELAVRIRDAEESSAQRQRLQEALENSRRELTTVGDRFPPLQGLGPIPTEPLELERLADVLAAVEGPARAFAVLVRSQQESRELEGLRGLVGQARERFADAEREAVRASQRAAGARKLDDAAKRAAVKVSERRFARIEPLLDETYFRLDPHPSFKALKLRHSVHYRRGETVPVVVDATAGIEANPLLIFSSAQANIVALASFFAINWALGERALPFMLLDDPLQSMDDVNVLAFADLCRHIRPHRQVVIGTHSSRFASLLERKLAPRARDLRTVAYDFEAWDREGPQVVQRDIPPQIGELRSA